MITDEHRSDLNSLTERIIGCVYSVSNTLGHGFLEKVYENALAYELKKEGLQVEQQKAIEVQYDGVVVGEYYSDLLVEENIIVELKATKHFEDAHIAQCLNYLKATGLQICLLLNFGKPKVEVKRLVWKF